MVRFRRPDAEPPGALVEAVPHGVQVYLDGGQIYGFRPWYEDPARDELQGTFRQFQLVGFARVVLPYLLLTLVAVPFLKRYHDGQLGVRRGLHFFLLTLGAGLIFIADHLDGDRHLRGLPVPRPRHAGADVVVGRRVPVPREVAPEAGLDRRPLPVEVGQRHRRPFGARGHRHQHPDRRFPVRLGGTARTLRRLACEQLPVRRLGARQQAAAARRPYRHPGLLHSDLPLRLSAGTVLGDPAFRRQAGARHRDSGGGPDLAAVPRPAPRMELAAMGHDRRPAGAAVPLRRLPVGAPGGPHRGRAGERPAGARGRQPDDPGQRLRRPAGARGTTDRQPAPSRRRPGIRLRLYRLRL